MMNLGRRVVASLLTVLMAFNIVMCNARSVDAAQEADEAGIYLNEAVDTYSKIIVSVSLGTSHSAAITENGSLYMWGGNSFGELGDGTTDSKLTPVKIMDNVAMVSLGGCHSGAVTKSGELYMWGYNNCGQLGDETTEEKNTPVKIMDNVKMISLGYDHSAAVTKSGELYMWGQNNCGQLGYVTEDFYSFTPKKIMDNVESVSLGPGYGAAVTKSGELYTWGQNGFGQLGDGTTENKSTPEKVMDNVAFVSLGGFHSAAVTKSGELYTWGDNSYGELGDGTYNNDNKPKKVMDNVEVVSLGSGYSGVVTKSGELYMWGYNKYGQLGNGKSGKNENKKNPVKIMDNVESVSLGNYHSGAVTKSGELYMWGYSYDGQLGNGTEEFSEVPVKPVFPPERSDYIRAFVERLYTLVLGRPADPAGASDWTNKLINKEKTGAEVGYGFVFSDEFLNRHLSNEEIVEVMYNTFLGRASDPSGKQYWVDAMNAGVDLERIFHGFVMSEEFKGICAQSQIEQGTVDGMYRMDKLNLYRNIQPDVTIFVARCYTKALQRAGEIDGIEDWCRQIITGAWTPRDVAANGFFHSDEFINKNTTNAEYVSILYQTFLGRELDEPGYEMWVGILDRNERTRDQVLDGFAESDEFATILAGFGLN